MTTFQTNLQIFVNRMKFLSKILHNITLAYVTCYEKTDHCDKLFKRRYKRLKLK